MPASNINLLPVELSSKSGIAKTAALLRRVSMFSVIVFLILGVMAGAFILIYTLQLEALVKSNQALTQQIAALEVTEQQTVLIKDRLQKIKGLETQSDILAAVGGIRSIMTSLPGGVAIADTTIDSTGKTAFAFSVADSSVLVSFLGNLVANSDYKELKIKSFSFTPATGYLVSFEAMAK